MEMFKNRKENKSEKKQEKLEELMERNNLEVLSDTDKKMVKDIFDNMNYTPLVGATSNKTDSAKLNLKKAIIDQNFLIIKLLSEINNKLDK